MTTEPVGESRWFEPDWPLPPGVRALQTTRCGGVSSGPWSGFNLGDHVGDDPAAVAANRAALAGYIGCNPRWLRQVHGTAVCDLDRCAAEVREADAALARQVGQVCVVMTADCLPVLLCADDGSVVGAVHAGWRGLAHGIVENTIAAMQTQPTWAWLGAAISQPCFEIGEEVKTAFCSKYPELDSAFKAGEKAGKFYADLYAIARFILKQHGVEVVLGGDQCSYTQTDEYFSYRRAAKTGRMATFVFMA